MIKKIFLFLILPLFLISFVSSVTIGETDISGVEISIVSETFLNSIDIDLAIPKRPVANPPGEGTEDGFPTLDYDDTTDESVFLIFNVPHNYKNGELIRVHLDFFVDTAPAAIENITWGLKYKKIIHGDIFDFDAGTTTITNTNNLTTGVGANKKLHESHSLSLTTTGFVPDDTVLMELSRDADNPEDSFIGDARLVNWHIEYQAYRLGTAT